MLGLFLLILLGSSLLVLADEREWIVYVKLALFLMVYGLIVAMLA